MDSFYATQQSYVLMNPYKKPATETAHGLPIYQPFLQSPIMPATSKYTI